jgi:glycosyltransferase involved in cell wall biosynthesis
MVRTAHFTDTYLPRRDGVVTSVLTLVAALAERGDPAVIVVPRHPSQPDGDGLIRLPALPCGVADLRVSPWPLRSALASGALAEIAAAAPDVIHVHTPGPIGLLGVLAARTLGVPLVQTYHTDLHAYADAYRLPHAALRGCLRLYAHRLGEPRPWFCRRPPWPAYRW